MGKIFSKYHQASKEPLFFFKEEPAHLNRGIQARAEIELMRDAHRVQTDLEMQKMDEISAKLSAIHDMYLSRLDQIYFLLEDQKHLLESRILLREDFFGTPETTSLNSKSKLEKVPKKAKKITKKKQKAKEPATFKISPRRMKVIANKEKWI